MDELTPEEEALYAKLYPPGWKPTSQPHRHGVVVRGGTREVVREAKPDRSIMNAVRPQWSATVTCRNGTGRPILLAAVIAKGPAGVVILAASDESHFVSFGADFSTDCRCGMTHEIDGGKLRSAVMSLDKGRRRPPSIDVFGIERVS